MDSFASYRDESKRNAFRTYLLGISVELHRLESHIVFMISNVEDLLDEICPTPMITGSSAPNLRPSRQEEFSSPRYSMLLASGSLEGEDADAYHALIEESTIRPLESYTPAPAANHPPRLRFQDVVCSWGHWAALAKSCHARYGHVVSVENDMMGLIRHAHVTFTRMKLEGVLQLIDFEAEVHLEGKLKEAAEWDAWGKLRDVEVHLERCQELREWLEGMLPDGRMEAMVDGTMVNPLKGGR